MRQGKDVSLPIAKKSNTTNKAKFKRSPNEFSEWHEQVLFVEWLRLKKVLFLHIPNGGSRNLIEAVRLKQSGVQKGIPDMFLPVPYNGYCGLWIEMKKRRGGVVSPEQRWWINKLNEKGFKALVCKGFEEAKNAVEEYFK